MKNFLKRYLVFKPLYKIEGVIDPNSRWPICKPKYPKFSTFVYEVAKWSIF